MKIPNSKIYKAKKLKQKWTRIIKCSMCNAVIHDYGHNASDLGFGRCCTMCNYNIVIPFRMGFEVWINGVVYQRDEIT